MSEAEQAIGRVVCVSGSQIITLLESGDAEKANVSDAGIQKGRLVKMLTPERTLFGLVNALSVPAPSSNGRDEEIRIVELEVLGEVDHKATNGSGGFKRGVSVFPALGDAVYSAGPEDLAMVYRRDDEDAVRIGTIHQDRDLPASIVPHSAAPPVTSAGIRVAAASAW